MSGKAKAKAKGISASSFLDLKAELSKQEGEFSRNKTAGSSKFIVGGVKRPDKKPTVWARQNNGVNARASRDIELEAISKPTLESARAALERKAKIYDKLKKGQTGGLNDKQYEMLLVDFDAKPVSDDFESDSDDLDESVEVARPPVVDSDDEFGRMRTARRSEVPRDLVRPTEEPAYDEDEDLVIHNPAGYFPVYQPSADRVAQIEKEHAEINNPLGVHYDASAEVRARGAGFYQFSHDEETRKAQMDELKSARGETEKTRKETGAVDVLPGEVEGMQDDGPGAGAGSRSRAMEKRKRELEERRKVLDAKRRKLNNGTETETASMAAPAPTASRETIPPVVTAVAEDPFAALEVAAVSKGKPKAPPAAVAQDPFAALEVASTSKGKAKASSAKLDADNFLAQLEQDFLNGKRK
ncbi:hypothetical protein C8F04DRAFT_1210441 [Mycena alexandri]|uniref:Uncharacterized protein n=1 Tax=Mycena alexandri TaxID=1745969 RepID=A0AAD6SX10_9AGAR|nr:hypothetical protein C8F04DRAFT_1210441 [Mycena alexandri]